MQSGAEATNHADPGLQVKTERLDDTPLLVGMMMQMGLPALLDKFFPRHGNWQGLSKGWLTVFWCAHILSQADHCVNHVEPWSESRLMMLSKCCDQLVRSLDFTDDRLAVVLEEFGNESKWCGFEEALAQNLIDVYELEIEGGIRYDSTTSSGHWNITEGGLFQHGHSKDHRPDLPQFKVMMAVLEPLGLPLLTTVVSGEKADDPLYLPAIEKIQGMLDRQGLLYVGDSKMAATQTRATVAKSKNYYLCVLPKKQLSAEELELKLQVVLSGEQVLEQCLDKDEQGQPKKNEKQENIILAEGYEYKELIESEVGQEKIVWEERRLVVRSLVYAEEQEKKLRSNVQTGLEEIQALNERKQGKKIIRTEEEAQRVVDGILKKNKAEGLLLLEYKKSQTERKIRGYKGNEGRIEVEEEVKVEARVDEKAMTEAIKRLGWRVLCTNAPQERLSFEKAVMGYRANYSIEGTNFRRLKGQPLSLRPMYLQREERVVGLVRLLGLCLRIMALMEYRVRERLAQDKEPLKGIYPGNPTRKTMRPSAELLLFNFREITFTKVGIHGAEHIHITPLSATQQRILALLGFPVALYQSLQIQTVTSSLVT